MTTPTREKQIAGGSSASGYPKYDQRQSQGGPRPTDARGESRPPLADSCPLEDYLTRTTSICSTEKHPHPTMEVKFLIFLTQSKHLDPLTSCTWRPTFTLSRMQRWCCFSNKWSPTQNCAWLGVCGITTDQILIVPFENLGDPNVMSK